MNDQYGRKILLGDSVTIQGTVTDLLENPNGINCTVELQQQMPPTGAQTKLDLNTQQLVKASESESPTPLQSTPQLLRQEQISRLARQEQARYATIGQIQGSLSQVRQSLEKLMAEQQQ